MTVVRSLPVPARPIATEGWSPGLPVPTTVWCLDPISREGVLSQLRGRPEVRVLPEARREAARVAVAVADQVDEVTSTALRDLREAVGRLVLVCAVVDDAVLVAAAEAGVLGLLRRSDATPEMLAHAVERVAAGHGELPADLVGRLMEQVGRLQRQVLAPRGLTFSGLSPREAQVVHLCADGHDTATIARRLCYSERTVKNVLHDLTVRLQLRNRTHLVAHALREGLI
jgi:DNA-binding NarL/FixJ family response regulator